jgi:hypothetical protein
MFFLFLKILFFRTQSENKITFSHFFNDPSNCMCIYLNAFHNDIVEELDFKHLLSASVCKLHSGW